MSPSQMPPTIDFNPTVPTDPNKVNGYLHELAVASRRSFMGRGAAAGVAGVATAAAVGLGSTADAATSTGLPSLQPGSTKRYFQQLQVDEAAHVNILIQAIRSLGGTPRPFPTFTGITNLSASQFLNASIALENTGVSAYFGAYAYIQNPAVAAVALSIATVEAIHAGFVNTTGSLYMTPGYLPYAKPLTAAEVGSIAMPYIANLNDGGQFPATYGTTPSASNDIAILNFALLLEFLEASYYFYNVSNLMG